MHPASADCSLHMSLLPSTSSKAPLQMRIPVSLDALAVPGRRNGLLREPWAAAASAVLSGAADVIGDMRLGALAGAMDTMSPGLQFLGLKSRAMFAGDSSHEPKTVATGQVCSSDDMHMISDACLLHASPQMLAAAFLPLLL